MIEEETIEKAKIHIEGDTGCGWSEDGRFILFTFEAFNRFMIMFGLFGGIVFTVGLLIGWRFF